MNYYDYGYHSYRVGIAYENPPRGLTADQLIDWECGWTEARVASLYEIENTADDPRHC